MYDSMTIEESYAENYSNIIKILGILFLKWKLSKIVGNFPRQPFSEIEPQTY